MERILLVEPNYKNKYPPIGLMKISTYFKNKGDFVEFHKGLLPQSEVITYNKALITTLFTFDFDMCIQTIRYYIAILGIDNVYVGGIAATIMPEKFLEKVPGMKLLTGQLVSSNLLGYTDDVNIDVLELDYDILWDIAYDYPAADSYFIYTTRGCPRKCSFCAVKTLEPEFYDCNNIVYQISNVDKHFGVKRQLLIMDNNILYSKNYDKTIDTLVSLGFGVQNNKVKKNNNIKYYFVSLQNRIKQGKKYGNLYDRIKKEFVQLKFSRINKADAEMLKIIIDKVETCDNTESIKYLLENQNSIIDFFERYNYHKIVRYVDFNQGLDARLFTTEKAKLMSRLAVKPCRIAFDDLKTQDEYFSAMEAAVTYGIRHFSNYLLYNYDEKPEALWKRLYLNIEFCKKHKEKAVSLFSFPMKYASIHHTDRRYIGRYWNKKFLRAINVILNVTSGVVAKEEDFFLRAFGQNEEEFIEILTMPDDFIRFRDFFEEKGFTQLWRRCYSKLTNEEKKELISYLEEIVDNPNIIYIDTSPQIKNILLFYSFTKKKVEKSLSYYTNLVAAIKRDLAEYETSILK